MFIICSYYTIETPYHQVMHDYLMPSLQERNLTSDIHAIDCLGSWGNNTSYKPTFIKQMLERHPEKDIVFLDADAQVLKHPDLFDQIPEGYHIAVHMLDKDAWYDRKYNEPKELLSGTLFVKNCSESHEIVNRWIRLCELQPKKWEQKVLQDVVDIMEVKIYELPISYCYIKTMPDGGEPNVKCEQPVIVHNQVSRELRNQI